MGGVNEHTDPSEARTLRTAMAPCIRLGLAVSICLLLAGCGDGKKPALECCFSHDECESGHCSCLSACRPGECSDVKPLPGTEYCTMDCGWPPVCIVPPN